MLRCGIICRRLFRIWIRPWEKKNYQGVISVKREIPVKKISPPTVPPTKSLKAGPVTLSECKEFTDV